VFVWLILLRTTYLREAQIEH